MLPVQDAVEAIRRGDLREMGRLLAEHPDLARARDEQGVTLLLLALYHRRPEIAEAVRSARTDPAEIDLWEASALGDDERVAACLEADPDAVDVPAADGFPPLHLAAFFGRRSTVERILEGGADVSRRADNPSRVMPLHSAVAGRDAGIVARLLEAGADPTATQQGGFTPLMGAAAAGDPAMVEALLARGAEPTTRNDDGRTAADLARDHGHGAVAARLGAPGAGR